MQAAGIGRVGDRELDARDGIAQIDEAARLSAGAVHGERMADDGFDAKAVEHGAEEPVVIEAVHQLRIAAGFDRRCRRRRLD